MKGRHDDVHVLSERSRGRVGGLEPHVQAAMVTKVAMPRGT